jgi:digeranylgeranylglycerophospholipid reductase
MSGLLSLQPIKKEFEVIVVGAGPVGSFTAWKLARLGIRVAVFEEHEVIGRPSHCAGHLSIRGLRNLGLYPLPEKIVENTFSRANFFSPSGIKFSVNFAKPVTGSLNREAFDRHIAQKAEDAGAHYILNSRVKSLLLEDNVVKGVKISRGDNLVEDYSAKIVVDAEGISSRLLRQTGLTGLNTHRLVNAVEAEVENAKEVNVDSVEVFLGAEYAPGFYAWLMPRLDGTSKIGLAARTGNPKELLQRFMFRHPIASKKLSKAKIAQMAFHPITLGGPIPKAYANGFLVVGDAASQVKPTTGGGVIFGLTCAGIAAEVANEALLKKDIFQSFLALYQKRCTEALGFDFNVMLRIRNFLDSLSDEKIDDVFRFCTRISLHKTLSNIEEIDFQGRLLLEILTKPKMVAALAYFLKLYLSANP